MGSSLFALLAACTSSPTRTSTQPTLFVAGDSTAATSSNPAQQGWGEPFKRYFDPAKIRVENRALGGRSSRTFITEGHWDRLVSQLKPGDFVLIQFGHNDAGALNEEPPGSTLPLRARGSIKSIGEETQEIDNVITKQHEVVHSFGWYIRKMIADVRAHHATPYVLSLTVRNEWPNGRVERANGHYREWDEAVARAEHVEFIDVTAIIADRYEAMGQEAVKAFFPVDHTHTNPEGADFNARCVVAGLERLPHRPFAKYLARTTTASK